MKRRHALTGLGLVAAIALVSTAIAGPGGGPADAGPAATAAKKKKAKPGPPGPAGPQGAQGPQGSQGAQGSPGTNGTNGATNVNQRTVGLAVNAGLTNSAIANCDAGHKATGGGYAQATAIADASIHVGASRPALTASTPTGWFVSLTNGSASNGSWVVYVICASP